MASRAALVCVETVMAERIVFFSKVGAPGASGA